MVSEGQMDRNTGQIPGSSFDGNIYDHFHSRNPTDGVAHTAVDGNVTMVDLENHEGNSALYQGGTIQPGPNTLAVSTTLVLIASPLSFPPSLSFLLL